MKKILKIISLHLLGFYMIFSLLFIYENKSHLPWHRHYYSNSDVGETETYNEDIEPQIEYLQDSTYKVVIDTLITVYNVSSGKKLTTLPLDFDQVKSLAMHPSGSHLAIMDDYNVNVYDLVRDNLADTDTTAKLKEETTGLEDDTTTVWEENITGIDATDKDEIAFSADGKYLMTINYSESEVAIYQWPGLDYLTTQEIGCPRKRFWWESYEGKLVFFYNETRYIYRTEFPSFSGEDSLSFSEPVLIDSVGVSRMPVKLKVKNIWRN